MRALFAIVLFCIAFRAGPAAAHESRPLFIELTEFAGGGIGLRTTAPTAVDRENAPRVTLKEPCIELRRDAPDPRRQRALYDCDIGDAAIVIDWPAYNPSISTLVRATYADGQARTAILGPSVTEWRAEAPDDFEGVARSYFRIGVGHIVGGIDHMLFLAGLLLIAGTARRALVTATGFTLAHSLTLALVALNLVRVSVPATEAVIALSIVFLAVEIARGDRTTIAWRRPILVAVVFGLVHGAGFAAALGEIGLPKTETVAALLFFNIGVEAGQIAMIAGAFLAVAALRVLPALSGGNTATIPLHRLAGYALGIVSAYWFIERVGVLIAPT